MNQMRTAWATNGLWSVQSSTAAIAAQTGGAVALIDGKGRQIAPTAHTTPQRDARAQAPRTVGRSNHVIADTVLIPDLSPRHVGLAVLQQLRQSLDRLSAESGQVSACGNNVGGPGTEVRNRGWSTPGNSNRAQTPNTARTVASTHRPTGRPGGIMASSATSGRSTGTATSGAGRRSGGNLQKATSLHPASPATTSRTGFSSRSARR
jgi:hypothetical protein